MGQAAAQEGAAVIREAIDQEGQANIILATGNSQLAFLRALRTAPDIDWPKVNVFHMDEYIGIDPDHPASFPNFLERHFLGYLDVGTFFPVPSHPDDLDTACDDYARLLRDHPAHLCALGFGENGHLAFNDPPFADFDDPAWVKVVVLDDRSRRQQVGEGHFASLDAVPTHAITLTIPALLAAKRVLAIVPEDRKADAVERSLKGPIAENVPASILRRAPHAHLFLDADSAAQAFPEVGAA